MPVAEFKPMPFNPEFYSGKPVDIIIDAFRQSAITIATPNGNPDLSAAKYPALEAEIQSGLAAALPPHLVSGDKGIELGQKTRKFLQAFLDKEVLQTIMPESLAHLTYISAHLAQQPHLTSQLVIDTGFGGSDSENSSLRNAAYAIPALKLWQNLASTSGFTPKLRFFWAIHGGIAVNGKDGQKSHHNAQLQSTIVEKFIRHSQPDALNDTFFEVDRPWDNLPESTWSVFAYLQSLIESAPGELAQSAVENLLKRGLNHANGSAREATMLYTAYHVGIFNDQVPFESHFFDKEFDAVFRLSIGSRAEKQFNAIRRDLTNRATLEGFLYFCQQKNLPYDQATSNPIVSAANAMLIGRFGDQSPPYFPIPEIEDHLLVDQENIANISLAQQKFTELTFQAESQLSGRERKIALKKIQSLSREWQAMTSFLGGEQQLIDFANSLG
jgi:hypothetical protein